MLILSFANLLSNCQFRNGCENSIQFKPPKSVLIKNLYLPEHLTPPSLVHLPCSFLSPLCFSFLQTINFIFLTRFFKSAVYPSKHYFSYLSKEEPDSKLNFPVIQIIIIDHRLFKSQRSHCGFIKHFTQGYIKRHKPLVVVFPVHLHFGGQC